MPKALFAQTLDRIAVVVYYHRCGRVFRFPNSFDEICTAFDVVPLEGELPVEVMAGVLHTSLQSWLCKTAIAAEGKIVWLLGDYRRNPENEAPFIAEAARREQLMELFKSGKARMDEGTRLRELLDQ